MSAGRTRLWVEADKKERSIKMKVKKKPATKIKSLEKFGRTGNWKIQTETEKGSWFKQSLLLTTDQQPLASIVTVCLSLLRYEEYWNQITGRRNSTKCLPRANYVLLGVSRDSIWHLFVSIGITISSFLKTDINWHVVTQRSDMLV